MNGQANINVTLVDNVLAAMADKSMAIALRPKEDIS